jgi:hypothetical protein
MSHVFQIEILTKIIAALQHDNRKEAKDLAFALGAPGLLDWPVEAEKLYVLLCGALDNQKQYDAKEVSKIASNCRAMLKAAPEARYPIHKKKKSA